MRPLARPSMPEARHHRQTSSDSIIADLGERRLASLPQGGSTSEA